MAAVTDELILLERVFLCLGSADTDEQLQALVCKFLPPVLLKLSSPQEGVRKKVMGLLIHINRRVKSRPKVQLPVEALLLQYQDPAASSFVINFTIIYIKMGYPRMEMKKQAELVPIVLNAIDGKPLSHQDSLLLVIMPALGQIEIPIDAEKRAALIGLHDKPQVAKHLLNFLLDMLLLPYGSMGQTDNQETGQTVEFPVPPGLSEYSFKRVIGESPSSPEQLEQIKLGIVKFISGGVFADTDVLIHLIVAAADTRFSVANAADLELKKIVRGLDWSSRQLAMPLYTLFLGTGAPGIQKDIKTDMKRVPANTRIRLKLMYYLCRVSKAGFIIPTCIHVVFESLYGWNNPNRKLKSLALEFTLNMVQQCNLGPLVRVAGVLLEGMIKLISEGEREHVAMAYTIIGQMGKRIPTLVNKDLSLLQRFFDALTTSEPELRKNVRDALICMSTAFMLNRDDENGIEMMNTLLAVHIESPEPNVRSVAGHYAATVFPSDHAPSRYLLLLASGDERNDISVEAMKALYGTAHATEQENFNRKEYFLPEFPQLVIYINERMKVRMERPACEKVTFGQTSLPYNVATFKEIIKYLRVCLAKSAGISFAQPVEHPCEHTPIIGRYLQKLFEEQPKTLNEYLDIIMPINLSIADPLALNAMLEIVGTIPNCMTERYVKELPWLRTLLTSTKVDIRNLAAQIHAIIIAYGCDANEFETRATEFLNISKNQALEHQHGALIALAWMFERILIIRRTTLDKEFILNWTIYARTVETLKSFLTSGTEMLMGTSAQGIGLLGKTFALPIPDEGDGKRANKKCIVENLFSIVNDVKINDKTKEKAILSLGQLCIGENFPYTKTVAQKFIELAKETKDISTHLWIAESLVLCVQGQASPKARDVWKFIPSEHEHSCSSESDELLALITDELLKLSQVSHPNSRQAVSIWLLAIVRHNAKRKQILARVQKIQSVFIDLLSENSDIVQDVASKGLCLVYDSSEADDRNELLSNLLSQLSESRRMVNQVTPDTQVIENSQPGTIPTGGNIATYREICSLASDVNKPELVYRFMHLANHNTLWTSEKGAALGFPVIENLSGEDLTKNLSIIVPKLYRYQFDPNPKTQQCMSRIWHKIVPSTQKILEQYHPEILNHLEVNLTNKDWRVRISCCLALADLLKSSTEVDLANRSPKLWQQLFRVMDDVHEDTRLKATATSKIFSKICIHRCDPSYGTSGELLLQAILPVFLDIGISHNVTAIRAISLQVVSELVTKAGSMLKPYLVTLIPALLTATDLESPKLNYMSNAYGAQLEIQEAVDSIRTNAAKNHCATETITKCTQYIDGPVLKDLMPTVIELMKSCLGLGTKVALSHFLILCCSHLKQELQPYAGKVLSALANGLNDRNAAVRKVNAVTIGHIVGSAKQSSLGKLFNMLNTWYMEREDDSIRLAIGQALQSINNYNNDIMKQYAVTVMPLIFFAMHAEKMPGNDSSVELWTDLWNETSSGTEFTVRQHLTEITNVLKKTLEAASWTMKAQAANAVSTIASKLGSTMDDEAQRSLLMMLTSGLQGRTWNGKERLVQALATLACNSKEYLDKNDELKTTVLEILYKESKKECVEYRRHAVQGFAEVLHVLNVDRFTHVYDIAQEILSKSLRESNGDDNDDDDDDDIRSTTSNGANKRENKLKLQETVYEALGKAWPSSTDSKDTQDKYSIQFVTHCNERLPNTTRPVQVAILITLNLFVDKLLLLETNFGDLNDQDQERLHTICRTINEILKHSIGISKYTRIRKEALNIVLSLSRKLADTGNTKEFNNLKILFVELLPELSQDNQPEIRTRMVDIKEILKI